MEIKGILKEAKVFDKEIILIRGLFIEMKDENGQCLYTFNSKKKADEFYKELKKGVVNG